MFSLFLRRGGTIECAVTGHCKYSAELAQGGLEVPCSLLFKATPEAVGYDDTRRLKEPVGSESSLLDIK